MAITQPNKEKGLLSEFDLRNLKLFSVRTLGSALIGNQQVYVLFLSLLNDSDFQLRKDLAKFLALSSIQKSNPYYFHSERRCGVKSIDDRPLKGFSCYMLKDLVAHTSKVSDTSSPFEIEAIGLWSFFLTRHMFVECMCLKNSPSPLQSIASVFSHILNLPLDSNNVSLAFVNIVWGIFLGSSHHIQIPQASFQDFCATTIIPPCNNDVLDLGFEILMKFRSSSSSLIRIRILELCCILVGKNAIGAELNADYIMLQKIYQIISGGLKINEASGFIPIDELDRTEDIESIASDLIDFGLRKHTISLIGNFSKPTEPVYLEYNILTKQNDLKGLNNSQAAPRKMTAASTIAPMFESRDKPCDEPEIDHVNEQVTTKNGFTSNEINILNMHVNKLSEPFSHMIKSFNESKDNKMEPLPVDRDSERDAAFQSFDFEDFSVTAEPNINDYSAINLHNDHEMTFEELQSPIRAANGLNDIIQSMTIEYQSNYSRLEENLDNTLRKEINQAIQHDVVDSKISANVNNVQDRENKENVHPAHGNSMNVGATTESKYLERTNLIQNHGDFDSIVFQPNSQIVLPFTKRNISRAIKRAIQLLIFGSDTLNLFNYWEVYSKGLLRGRFSNKSLSKEYWDFKRIVPLHPILKEVFLIDFYILIELLQDFEMDYVEDGTEEQCFSLWISGLYSIHRHLSPLSLSLFQMEKQLKAPISTSEAIIIIRDRISVVRMTMQNTSYSGINLSKLVLDAEEDSNLQTQSRVFGSMAQLTTLFESWLKCL